MRIRTIGIVLGTLALMTTAPAGAAGQDTAGRNEAVVRALFDEAWSAGNYERLPELVSPELRFNFRGRSRPMSHKDFQGMVGMWRSVFPDLRFAVEDIVGTGDRVAARFVFSGTQRGELFGIAPTGRSVNVSMMAFFRLADGKVVEMWEDYDEHGMRQQLTRPATQ